MSATVGGQLSSKLGGAVGAQATSAIGGLSIGGFNIGGFLNSMMRSDPDISYNFFLQIDGIREVHIKEVSGLKCTTELETLREGGNNVHERYLMKGMKFDPLKVKRGYFGSNSQFYAWMRLVHDAAPVKRKNIGLVVLNDSWVDVATFNLYNAIPVGYTGPSFDAMAKGTIAFEEIEIRYEYFEVEVPSFIEKAIKGGVSAGISMAASAVF